MNSEKIVEDLEDAFGSLPVEGRRRSYVFHLPMKSPAGPTQTEMTVEDWDKFEKDIADAFERVP